MWVAGGGAGAGECNTVGSIIGQRAMLVNRSRSTNEFIKRTDSVGGGGGGGGGRMQYSW